MSVFLNITNLDTLFIYLGLGLVFLAVTSQRFHIAERLSVQSHFFCIALRVFFFGGGVAKGSFLYNGHAEC